MKYKIFLSISASLFLSQTGLHQAIYNNTEDNTLIPFSAMANTCSDQWTQKADFGGTGRYSAVGFSIGRKGYILTGKRGNYLKDFWEYDPTSDKWTQKADFPGTARDRAVGFSIGAKGYIGTGYDGFLSHMLSLRLFDRTSFG